MNGSAALVKRALGFLALILAVLAIAIPGTGPFLEAAVVALALAVLL